MNKPSMGSKMSIEGYGEVDAGHLRGKVSAVQEAFDVQHTEPGEQGDGGGDNQRDGGRRKRGGEDAAGVASIG